MFKVHEPQVPEIKVLKSQQFFMNSESYQHVTHRKVSGCEGARWRRGGRGDRTRDPGVTDTHSDTWRSVTE
uniref:Uncharacterized protein n=1 Tax=Magallana gigas TaxID=29159 RepID=K1PK73_MAGGI